MMEPIDVIASLHRITKDREGEVTLSLKVPRTHANRLMLIQEELLLRVHIEEQTA